MATAKEGKSGEGKSSPEYKSFHSKYSSLCDLFAANQTLILPFAVQLYSNNIISQGIYQSVVDGRNPPYERITTIMSAVEGNMILNPQEVFEQVVFGLKKVDLMMALKELVKTLESNGGIVSSEIEAIINPVSSPESQPSLSSLQDLQLNDSEPELSELMNTAGVMLGAKWKQVAIKLGFDDSDVETIEEDNDFDTLECIRDMFEQWESRATSPYLWSTLKATVDKGKAQELEKKRQDLKNYKDKYIEFAHMEPELSDLLEQVGGEVSQKWRHIGIQLNLGRSTLSNIARKRRSSDIDKIIHVFSEWKSQMSSPYNWKTMLTVLTVPHVNEKKLAATVCNTLMERNKK